MVVRPSQVVLLVRDLKRLHPVVEREHQGLVLQSQGASKADFKKVSTPSFQKQAW